jgi:hypothetical protein
MRLPESKWPCEKMFRATSTGRNEKDLITAACNTEQSRIAVAVTPWSHLTQIQVAGGIYIGLPKTSHT